MTYAEKELRIICIENKLDSCEAILNELTRLQYKITFKHVSSSFEFKEELEGGIWDLVISNYDLPGFLTMEALELCRKFFLDLPFILVSEKIDEEVVADMMKAGIEDVVVKSRIERLTPVIKRILREHEIKEKEARVNKVVSEALAAKEQMLAIVSHDIKNPLSAIQLEAQMLIRATERSGKSLLAEEVKIQAKRILKTTDRLKTLISDLLDKEKTGNGLAQISKSEVDFKKLLQEVLDSMRPLIQAKELTFKNVLIPEIMVPMDRNKMFQVISNLINNAIKFTPIGGVVTISTEENAYDFIFYIEDSGPGLETVELHKVFEKYWTGSSPNCAGTGLGLFICKSIIEAHGGNIFVENISEKGGARFGFNLPKKLASELEKSPSRQEFKKDTRKQIFVIDDDEDLREVICWALSKEGYSIHSFSCPQEALKSLRMSPGLPSLIVVDFHMDEMKGSEFVILKNQIKVAKDCPVIMMSASPLDVQSEVPVQFYKEIITKPIDLEGLVDNVKVFLN